MANCVCVVTDGMPGALPTTPVLTVPVKLMTFCRMVFVGRSAVTDETLLAETMLLMLIVSAPPPMSIAPTIFDPGNNVSVSAAGLSLIAVPPVPAIVPELVITLPTFFWPSA